MTCGQEFKPRLDDETVTGDVRVTWLIGRAFAEEALVSHLPRLLRGREYLEEATLVAESDDYRYWALSELATRHVALGFDNRARQCSRWHW